MNNPSTESFEGERKIHSIRKPKIWLLGAYFQKEYSGRIVAFYEVLFSFIIGTLPFWIGGIVLVARGKGLPVSGDGYFLEQYWNATRSTIERGELLIFAISFLSPALWLAAHEPEGGATLPHRRPIMVGTLLIAVIATALFALIQAQLDLDMPAIYKISLWLTAVAVLLMYLALTYHGFRTPKMNLNETDLRRPQNKFMDEFAKHRGQS
ncbi:hypothetical protein [Variovorax sp. UC74_104]|uniref:hypothetical protein n=1 Tax=Variovorax sp. UC74_104 TaxID=3374555 RepID=UPI0037574EAC